MTQLSLLVFLSLLVHVHSQCLTVLAQNCLVGPACCANLACFRGLCLPCVPAGSTMMCNTGQCCAGASCINGRCFASPPLDNPAAPTTPSPPPNNPVAPTTCAALLTSCQVGAAPNTATACCSGSFCALSGSGAVCYPCLAQSAPCYSRSRCCDGLICSAGRCQPSSITANPLPNDPVTLAPTTTCAALQNPCQVGAAPNTATACCSGSFCASLGSGSVCFPCLGQNDPCLQGPLSRCCQGFVCSAGRCQPSTGSVTVTPAPTTQAPGLDPVQCIGSGNTTTCVDNAQDTRRCCDGLTCVGGLCQTSQTTGPTATTAAAVTTQAPTAAPCAQLGAQCSATSPCCPGGLTCSPITGTCDFVVVGRRTP